MKACKIINLMICLVLVFCAESMAAGVMCGKKINSFDFVVDYSGSMMMQSAEIGEPKIDIAKIVLARINSIIPALDYYGGMHTLAPAITMLNQGPWDRNSMNESISRINDDLPIFGRLTPMGTGLKGYEPWISSMNRNAALIIATDGGNNRGLGLVDVVKDIYANQRDLVVHIISFAQTREERDVIAQIATLNPHTLVADGIKLASDDRALEQFATDVWCDQTEEVIVLRGVNFAFDSSNLDHNAQNILNEVANIIKVNPGKRIMLGGWTDIVGDKSYNMTLSQNRANAVKNYLSAQGIPASRMDAVGHGISHKYNNNTKEGRYLNRRVEISFE